MDVPLAVAMETESPFPPAPRPLTPRPPAPIADCKVYWSESCRDLALLD